jgi:hypothetical protein
MTDVVVTPIPSVLGDQADGAHEQMGLSNRATFSKVTGMQNILGDILLHVDLNAR